MKFHHAMIDTQRCRIILYIWTQYHLCEVEVYGLCSYRYTSWGETLFKMFLPLSLSFEIKHSDCEVILKTSASHSEPIDTILAIIIGSTSKASSRASACQTSAPVPRA